MRDDVWGAGFTITEQNVLKLQKANTDLRNLHTTLPKLMSAFSNILRSPEFRQTVGENYSRVADIVFKFHQQIHLEGRGTARSYVRNSDTMQQFLRLKSGKQQDKSTLEALGIQSDRIGRVDMKVSFQKEIDEHEYRIFFSVEAPANDNHTLLDIEWEIQDHNPGILPERKFGPILHTFFKDIVIRSFYHRWFQENDDIICTTLKQ